MAAFQGTVLPYRTHGEDLVRLVEARARGRSVPQIRALNFSAKAFDGTLVAAQALGFFDLPAEELTEKGRRFALAPHGERQQLLLDALTEFEPYGLLLEAISTREVTSVTEADWIERWWATHGYGSSESNRAEAAATFGRLVEFAGRGAYIPGRRGHPTRIEWKQAGPVPAARGGRADTAEPAENSLPLAPPAAQMSRYPAQGELLAAAEQAPRGYSIATLEVSSGQVARIRVPSFLTRAEKQRLMTLLDLLIRVSPGE